MNGSREFDLGFLDVDITVLTWASLKKEDREFGIRRCFSWVSIVSLYSRRKLKQELRMSDAILDRCCNLLHHCIELLRIFMLLQ